MKFNQAQFVGNQLIIKGQKSPFVIRATLVVVLMICLLMPIAATIALMSERKGPHIGIFISFIFFWGIGFYLLRIILWNSFGREILTIEDDKIFYEADYRFFKDGKTSISTKSIVNVVIPSENEKVALGVLAFSNEKKYLETVLKVPYEDMMKIKTEIENRY